MKHLFILSILCLVGCGSGFTEHEYDLDENSFKTDTIEQIKKESGIDIPNGAKGLKFHYIPPIDPIIFAKIEIPADAEKSLETKIAALADMPNFPKDFANDRCQWWPSNIENIIISRKAFSNGYYVEAYLTQEKEQLILYLKYFTS